MDKIMYELKNGEVKVDCKHVTLQFVCRFTLKSGEMVIAKEVTDTFEATKRLLDAIYEKDMGTLLRQNNLERYLTKIVMEDGRRRAVPLDADELLDVELNEVYFTAQDKQANGFIYKSSKASTTSFMFIKKEYVKTKSEDAFETIEKKLPLHEIGLSFYLKKENEQTELVEKRVSTFKELKALLDRYYAQDWTLFKDKTSYEPSKPKKVLYATMVGWTMESSDNGFDGYNLRLNESGTMAHVYTGVTKRPF